MPLVAIKSEFDVISSEGSHLLSQGSLNFFGGSTLTDTMHGSCISLAYPDHLPNLPLLPSLQSNLLISHSLSTTTAPVVRVDNNSKELFPILESTVNSEIEKNSNSISTASTSLGLPNQNENQNIFLQNKNIADRQFSRLPVADVICGRLSPTSVSERSISFFKNENSYSSLLEASENTVHHDEDDDYTNGIDFDSVCEALNINEVQPNSTLIMQREGSAESWRNSAIDTKPIIQPNNNAILMPSSTAISPVVKRTRQSSTDDDVVGMALGTQINNMKRMRRMSSIVPYPRKSRTADYTCSRCSESYQKVVEDNSWWAVYVQTCPHCRESQVPRIDVNLQSNAIELDPNMTALYGDGSGDSDEEDDDSSYEYVSDDEDCDFSASSNNVTDQVNFFPFGQPGELSVDEASRLVMLMCHARRCIGRHASASAEDTCRGVKFMMLHVRDCTVSSSSGAECGMCWCVQVKKLMFHLTHCYDASGCVVCSPSTLPHGLASLQCVGTVKMEKSADGKMSAL